MDGSKKIIVISGPYKFQIIDNTLFSKDKTEIYSRSFKILELLHDLPSVFLQQDGVNISIIYENNKPVDASMLIRLSRSPSPRTACLAEAPARSKTPSVFRPLEKGGGVKSLQIIMIKTLLHYVYTQLPTLTHIKFDDKSSIECKKGTYVKPIPLYYFSILFNGETWYEKYFNAKQKDEVRHQQYRTRVTEFLYSTECKTNMRFDRFVSFIDKREEEMTELYQYYNNTNSFNDFFQSIPKQHRCRLVGSWIEQFMKFILKDVFYNENWIIQFPIEMSGGNNKIQKYYCPKGIITNNFQSKNICISPEDI